MTENNRFIDDEIESVVDQSFTDTLTDKTYWIDNGLGDIVNLLNNLYDENNQLIKDNFELQGLLGDVRALLRLDKFDDAISRIDKFERSMKK